MNRKPLKTSLRTTAAVLALAIASAATAQFRSPLEDASAIQQQLRAVVDRSARSVYAVTAFADAPRDARLYASEIDGPTFAAIADRLGRSCGSAFAIDSGGLLVTNEHVISGAASVWVTDDTGRVLPAVVLGSDPRTDLAVLQLPVQTAALAIASREAARGDLTVAIGNPDGLATDGELSASVGCISATARSLPTLSARERRSYADLLQTTTPVAVGGSGGPLVNLGGEVLGVVSAVATADRDGMPVGFAIPLSPAVAGRIAKLARGEEIVHPYFGISITAAAAAPPTDSSPRGARIERVEAATPADGLLTPGDVVLSVAGNAVTGDRAFLQLAGACQVEQPVPMTVRRDGQVLNIVLKPTRRPLPAEPVTRATQSFTWAGVTFTNDEHAVRVTAIADDATPLKVGSIIKRVDGEATQDVAALARILHARAGQTLSLDAE